MQEIIIDNTNEGQRLNKYLGRYLDDAPQSFIYKMLRKKNIKYNHGKASGNEILCIGDVIQIYMTDETIANFRKDKSVPVFKKISIDEDHNHIKSSNNDFKYRNTETVPSLDILYEDPDVLILNKPTDVLSQKANPGDYSLNEQIVDYYRDKANSDDIFTPSVCNRLDRNTSGVIVAGMSLKGSRCLSMMLKERTLDKYYLTVVSGNVKHTDTVKGYLAKQSTHNQVTIYQTYEEAVNHGVEKPAFIETRYEPLSYGRYGNQEFTLLKVKLITGKTHQIRAHLHSIGYPIIGDGKYGNKQINQMVRKAFRLKHQLLHAYCMTFPNNVMELNENLSGRSMIAPPTGQFIEILNQIFHILSLDELNEILYENK